MESDKTNETIDKKVESDLVTEKIYDGNNHMHDDVINHMHDDVINHTYDDVINHIHECKLQCKLQCKKCNEMLIKYL